VVSLKWQAFLAVALLAGGLDQLAKWGVRTHLEPAVVEPVLGSFFVLERIDGPALLFGFFGEVPQWLLIAASALGLSLLASLLLRSDSHDRLAGTALGLIVGGAIGNLIDRFYHLQVIDFMRFDLGFFVFPSFNLADAWIVLGIAVLLLDIAASEASEVTASGVATSDASASNLSERANLRDPEA